MFIKNRVIRYILGITFSIGYFILLYNIKSKLLNNPNSVFPKDMFYSFSLLQNKYSVLGICGVVTLIVAILSLVIGYRLYVGRLSRNPVVKRCD